MRSIFILIMCLFLSSCAKAPLDRKQVIQPSAWETVDLFKNKIQSKDDLFKYLGEPKLKVRDKMAGIVWIFEDGDGNQRFNIRFDPAERELLSLTYFPRENENKEFSRVSIAEHFSLKDCSEKEEVITQKDLTLIRNHFECKNRVKAIFDSNSVLSITVSKKW